MIPTARLVAVLALPLFGAVAAGVVPEWVWAVVAADLVIAAVAVGDAVADRARLSVERVVEPRVAVGAAVAIELIVRGDEHRPLQVRVVDEAPGEPEGLPVSVELPSGAEATLRYRTRVDRRGRHDFGAVVLRWATPLGLWERQRRFPVPSTLEALPDFRKLRTWGVTATSDERRAAGRVRRKTGGDSEFERLRPYVPGDPYRHIDWRASARQRTFISREYGQESNQNVVFLLDGGRLMGADAGGRTRFDHALDAALSMAQVALRRGDRVGLAVFDREVRVWVPPRGGARQATALLRSTFDRFPRAFEPDMRQALRHLASRVRRRSLVVLLTTVFDDVNAEAQNALVSALARRHLVLTVWLQDPELVALAAGTGDVHEAAAAAELLSWRRRSLDKLARRGALVIDCAPDELGPELLATYLQVKARRLL